MNYFENNRVYMNAQDNALQIAGPQSLDSGSYTCVASNGIDSASASATLRVQVDYLIYISSMWCGCILPSASILFLVHTFLVDHSLKSFLKLRTMHNIIVLICIYKLPLPVSIQIGQNDF